MNKELAKAGGIPGAYVKEEEKVIARATRAPLKKTARIPATFCGPTQSESIMFHYESLNSKNIPWKFYYHGERLR